MVISTGSLTGLSWPVELLTQVIATRQQRVFVATTSSLYWTEVGEPENFNHADRVIPVGDDGDTITGLAVYGDALVIFKRNAIYMLAGADPNSWQIIPIDKSIGCASAKSIGYFGGRLFWMSLKGPRALSSTNGGVVDITTPLVGNLFDASSVHEDDLAAAVVVGNPNENMVGWAVTPIGESTNTRIVPFHYGLDRWMSSGWDVVDVRSCVLVNDANSRAWPMVADYDGFVYQLGVGTQDGLPTGEGDTNGELTGATSTTLTNTDANWTPDIFVGRYVTVVDGDVGIQTAQRRKIISNTSDTLEVATAFAPTPSVGDTYAIGGIVTDIIGGERNGGGGAFYKKRMEFLFAELDASAPGDAVQVVMYKDGNLDTAVLNRRLQLGSGSLWNVALWNVAEWDTREFLRQRLPIRTTGFTWTIRLLHLSTGNQIELHRTAVQWLTKTRKQGRIHAHVN